MCPHALAIIGRATIFPEGSVIRFSRVGQHGVSHRVSAATGRERSAASFDIIANAGLIVRVQAPSEGRRRRAYNSRIRHCPRTSHALPHIHRCPDRVHRASRLCALLAGLADAIRQEATRANRGDINLGRSGNTRFHDRTDDNPGYYVAGRFDDFRIINRALSAEEVRALAK